MALFRNQNLYTLPTYVTVHSAPFAKPPLRGSPLLRSSFLLISWRSLRTFMQADFHASMKSAHKNVRVNCNLPISDSFSAA